MGFTGLSAGVRAPLRRASGCSKVTRMPSAPIVVGFDPRSARREAVEFGVAASRRLGVRLVIVAVLADPPLAAALGRDGGREAVALDALRMDLRRRGAAASVKVVEAATAGAGLIHALAELRPLAAVLGTTERGGVGAALLGTTVERLIHAHACPVAVVPRGYAGREAAAIGAAYAPTPEGRDALATAAALARAGVAKLQAITVLDPALRESPGVGSPPAAEIQLRQALAEVAGDLEAEVDVVYGDPATGLLAASAALDLLVVGSRGFGPRLAMALGSVSRRVAERAICPVLVLPRDAADRTQALLARAAAVPSAS
jgi:nucleotide-binding universal stress UspA family protein